MFIVACNERPVDAIKVKVLLNKNDIVVYSYYLKDHKEVLHGEYHKIDRITHQVIQSKTYKRGKWFGERNKQIY